jgi:DNA-binding response OmpR family regulator
MKILFVTNDHQHARDLYTQFLSYRGTSWNLVHASSLAAAQDWLAYDQFDVVLVVLPAHGLDHDYYAQFVERAANELPVLVLTLSADESQFVTWVQRGAFDCLNGQVAHGNYIMRRLRMAVMWFHQQRKRQDQRTASRADDRWPVARNAWATNSEVHANAPARVMLQHRLRLAVVADSEWDVPQRFENDVTVTHAELDELNQMWAQASDLPDAVIVQHAVAEHYGDQSLYRFLGDCPVAVIVLTTDVSDNTALVVVDHGADDCVIISRTSNADLTRAIRLAITRRARACPQPEEPPPEELAISDRRAQSRSRDRRAAPRYFMTRPVVVIPVLPNGAPDAQGITEAFSIDLSTNGVAFQMGLDTALPSRNWVVGIEAAPANGWPQEYHFANVVTRNVTFLPGGVRLGTQFRHADDDLLRHENLMPHWSNSHHLQGALPGHVLQAWYELGVLKPTLLHRLKTCPECAAALVLGSGCRECGSPAISARQLVHHFACALIDDYEKFCTPAEGLKCPKCLTGGLVSGADFEVINARYQCAACGCQQNQPAQVATCLNCCLRLPVALAQDMEVYGYDVARLDVLAYLSATT